MALKRGATQFEQQYHPSRIGNWELPDTPGSLPKAHHGATRFIANDRGHLLQGEKRSGGSPWTNFRRTDTWEGPRRPSGPHSHDRPGYQNILRAPEDRLTDGATRESRPKGAAPARASGDAPHHTEAKTDPSAPTNTLPQFHAGADMELQVSGSAVCSPLPPRRPSRCGSTSSLNSLRSARLRPGGAGLHRGESPGRPAETPPLSAGGGVSRSQIDQLLSLERERRDGLPPEPESTPPPASPMMDVPGQFARAMRRDNFSHWPVGDFQTDAVLLAEKRPGVISDRTVAIRPLIHPGPTNCSKNVIVRPKTAPIEPPPPKPPLLAKRPKTALARKIPEIEYALCWNLQPSGGAGDGPEPQRSRAERQDHRMEKRERLQDVTEKTDSPESGDSGVQTPRQAWPGPDSEQLADRLRELQTLEGKCSPKEPSRSRITLHEPAESGYNTPVFRPRLGLSSPSLEEKPQSYHSPTGLTPPKDEGKSENPLALSDGDDSSDFRVRIKSTPTVIPGGVGGHGNSSSSPYSKPLELKPKRKILPGRKNIKETGRLRGRQAMDRKILGLDEYHSSTSPTLPGSDDSGNPQSPIDDPLYPRNETPSHRSTTPGASPIDLPGPPICYCTCGLGDDRLSASAPDLGPGAHTVSTQTFEPQMELRCKINPNRRLMSRPCRACQFYKKQPRDVPTVRSDYRAAFRAGCANYRPDAAAAAYLPQSKRAPRLAVRRPEPRATYATKTLVPPFAVWKDRRNDEYPERDRLKTTYGLMNRTVHHPQRATSFQSLVYK